MSADEAVVDGTNGPNPQDRVAIGISFGNSNSSIAYTTSEDKAEVIANEDGGMCSMFWLESSIVSNILRRSSNTFDSFLR